MAITHTFLRERATYYREAAMAASDPSLAQTLHNAAGAFAESADEQELMEHLRAAFSPEI